MEFVVKNVVNFVDFCGEIVVNFVDFCGELRGPLW